MKISKLVTKYLLVGGCFVAFFGSLSAQIPQSEREALINFYNSTNGTSWPEEYRWNLNKIKSGDISGQFGLQANENNTHVAIISLTQAKLSGTLPQDLFEKLPELQIFNIGLNHVGGTIPKGLSKATKLVGINLQSNKFIGKIPDLSKLKNLRILEISFLSDIDPGQTIPDITNFKMIQYFGAYGNKLKGSIPENIGDLRELNYFDVGDNELTGHLPASLNKCTKLNVLSVMFNKLSGEIPDLSDLTELGPTPDMPFGRLFLSNNEFTGAFPKWITKLKKLDKFSIKYNKLTGEIPEDLSGMENLDTFYASGNNLTGKLPKKFGPKIEQIDLSWNNLEGEIPTEWGSLNNLWILNLSHNNLHGYVTNLLYQTRNKKPKDMFETIEVYANHFSFYDFRDWVTFAKDENAKFRFSLQKPYSEKQKIEVNKGQTITLDATIKEKSVGDESYQWFDLNTGKPINDANKPILEIANASEKDAHRYVCFVTTKMFGTNYEGVKNMRSEEESPTDIEKKHDKLDAMYSDLAPRMQSGYFDVYVDGKSIAHTEEIAESNNPYLYPTTISEGDSWHINNAEHAVSVSIYRYDGSLVMYSNNIDEIPCNLSSGNYIAIIGLKDGQHISQVIEVK